MPLQSDFRLNYDQLRQRCAAQTSQFYNEGTVVPTPDGIYIYKDRGSSILAVAHLDTKQEYQSRFEIQESDRGTRIESTQLDDRLGAYILLDQLPTLGVMPDILLTEGEERHRSTACHFMSGRKYNWMFSFDRGGTDVVMYQYEDDAIQRMRLCRKKRNGWIESWEQLKKD